MIAMNAEMFNQYLNEGSKPVLVEFWAPWCVYCRRIAPVLKKMAQEREDVVIAQINIDEEPLLAHQEHIEVLPTLILYQNGQALGSFVAPEAKAKIEEFLEDNLGF